MTSFSATFLLSVKNKIVGQAWSEFKNVIHDDTDKFIPSKFIGSKKHLAWTNILKGSKSLTLLMRHFLYCL